jgi:DNA repair exonuclease SbcCD ATPase subunit
MISDTDANKVLTREEREDLVLDLYFKENKTYSEIAKIAKISPRDIKPIIDKAYQEKERQAHKSLSVQAYDLFSQGKTPLQVSVILHIGATEVTHYYTQYLSLVRLDDITKIYLEFKGDVSYFVKLCKEAKEAKMGIPQVINLLRIANNYLPSVQRRYNELQRENNVLESIIRDKSVELQNLNGQIRDKQESLEAIKSECRGEAALLEGLQQHRAKLEAFVYNYKNNDKDYIKTIKSIENKIHDSVSEKKPFLKLAIFSLIHSMRNNPDKYASLIYHNNHNQSKGDFNLSDTKWSRDVTLPPPLYDEYIIEGCKTIVLEESEKLYNILTDQLLCDVINENVAKQSTETMPSSLPALPFEEGGVDDENQN